MAPEAARAAPAARDPVRAAFVPVRVRDPAASLLLLARLVASFEEGGPAGLEALIAAGLPTERVEQLRALTMADAARLADGLGVPGSICGVAMAIDLDALARQLDGLQRAREERGQYEAFVRGGASAQLLRRLFGVRIPDARLHRRLLSPGSTIGGRPKAVDDLLAFEIEAAWRKSPAGRGARGERERYWQLHQQFSSRATIGEIEWVVRQADATPGRDGRPSPVGR